jgi:peptidoglycan hydrolase-like protein with peptidoglycan-binding domain
MRNLILIILIFFNSVACTTINQTDETQALSDQTEQLKQQAPKKTEAISKELAWAQSNLDILGYNPDNFDGKLTPKTRAALSAFQMDVKLPITGKLDDSTYQALDREVQRKLESEKPPVVSPPPQEAATPQKKQEAATPQKKQEAATPQKKRKETIKKKKTSENKKVTSPVRAFTNIQAVGVHLVAARLAEIGYFQPPLKQAKLETVEAALKSFQGDIGVTATGLLDDVTWKKLQNIKLSSARQAELDAVAPPAAPAKKKTGDPAMPDFTLKTGESVFVIEKIECKSENEALVLFYEGQLQELQDSQVEVNVKKRYAMWYDIRHEGVSKTDWWCIPKKRFCYSSVSFTDWDGKLKSGEVASFEKKLTMPSRFDIVSLVAQSSKRECSF